jgi:hypothetical protein
LEKRTKELVEQRRLERACLEQECAKMERQKKYLLAMLRYLFLYLEKMYLVTMFRHFYSRT